jgi:hypothetical protein
MRRNALDDAQSRLRGTIAVTLWAGTSRTLCSAREAAAGRRYRCRPDQSSEHRCNRTTLHARCAVTRRIVSAPHGRRSTSDAPTSTQGHVASETVSKDHASPARTWPRADQTPCTDRPAPREGVLDPTGRLRYDCALVPLALFRYGWLVSFGTS